MKNLKRSIAILALSLMAFTASAQSDEALIGLARAAAHDCIKHVSGLDVSASVETTGICFVEGSLHRVFFTARPHCPGNQACPFFAILVATVDFDCDNNVIAVNCSF